jgi:hypothetical protein
VFSRIRAILRDGKNENSTYSSLLEGKVLFSFLLLSQTILFSQPKLPKHSFGESFLHALLFLEKAGSTA